MRTAERVVIYAGLALCLTLAAGWRPLSAPAMATAAAPAPAPAFAADVRIASVDLLRITEKLTLSDRYRPAREAKMKELQDGLVNRQGELAALEQQIRAMPDFQTNPQAKPLLDEYQNKRTAFESADQAARAFAEEYNVEQIKEAYRVAVDTARDLAQQQGYSHVIASRPGNARLDSTRVQPLLQELVARPLVLGSEADDLTAAVEAALQLTDIQLLAPGVTPAADPTAAPAPAPGASAPATEPATPTTPEAPTSPEAPATDPATPPAGEPAPATP